MLEQITVEFNCNHEENIKYIGKLNWLREILILKILFELRATALAILIPSDQDKMFAL